MPFFIVSWVTTVEADNEEDAVELAQDLLDEGNVTLEVEEVEVTDEVDLDDE
jgi:hypothetical protein